MVYHQGAKEVLQDYMDKFNQEDLWIKKLIHSVAMHIVMPGPGFFNKSLVKKELENLIQLKRRVEKYIYMEEILEAKKEVSKHLWHTSKEAKAKEQGRNILKAYSEAIWKAYPILDILERDFVEGLLDRVFPVSKAQIAPP